ncbi:hypothetical protein FB566_1943 [Stackebrandtia endophytica]|uniref:Uncharacterized protein n=1 Tax=Stackebrandtia endophytica TaxID=1496996 RepID=A0A543AV22_9ACTN|nr:hypothetical protein [Stackebrandtia endophytica]TQL76414.1 hypothetical protein FB566_1943 [Stackebrandtia endophytica]
MVLAAANPGSATSAANGTNTAAESAGAQAGSAEGAAQSAKAGGGELSAFTGKCDELGESLVSALRAAEGEGVDTGNGLGESAADAVNTDSSTSGDYAAVPNINVQLV